MSATIETEKESREKTKEDRSIYPILPVLADKKKEKRRGSFRESFETKCIVPLLVGLGILGSIVLPWATEGLWLPMTQEIPVITPMTVYAISLILSLAGGALFMNSTKLILQEQQRAVIEKWGAAYWKTLGPGVYFLIPAYMQVRAVTSVWNQTIQLFLPDKDGKIARIETEDNTTVTPKDIYATIRLRQPDEPYTMPKKYLEEHKLKEEESMSGVFRSIYISEDWRADTSKFIENALRAALNKKTVKQILDFGHSSNVLQVLDEEDENEKSNNGEERTRRDRLDDDLAYYGIAVFKVTCKDFTPSPDAEKARQRKYNAMKEVEISEEEIKVAAHRAQANAKQTMGTLIAAIAEQTGKSVQSVQGTIEKDKDLKKTLLSFVQQRDLADKGSYLEIRGGGKGKNGSSATEMAMTAYVVDKMHNGSKRKGKKTDDDDDDD